LSFLTESTLNFTTVACGYLNGIIRVESRDADNFFNYGPFPASFWIYLSLFDGTLVTIKWYGTMDTKQEKREE
jgi:hypothetical protein